MAIHRLRIIRHNHATGANRLSTVRPVVWRVALLLVSGILAATGSAAEPVLTEAVQNVPAQTVAGTVFQDDNGNGLPDADEDRLPGIEVSDGDAVTLTDLNGRYSLTSNAAAQSRFVFVVTPSGYRSAGTFYRSWPSAAEVPAILDFPLVPEPARATGSFAFLHITDLHLSNQASVRLFTDLMRQAQAVNAAFVVATGDLTSSGNTVGAQLPLYAAAAQAAPLPVFSAPGNHDVGGASDSYEKALGPTHYAFDWGDRHFVVLDSQDESPRQLSWLQGDLALQAAKADVFVFLHYPPTAQLMEILAPHSVRAVFSGHWHSSRVVPVGSILTVNTPPPFFGGIDLSPRTARLVTVAGDRMTLDDLYPGAGLRATWKKALVRPEPAADAVSPALANGWPMLLHDPERTGHSRDTVVPPLKLAWRRTLGGGIHVSSPVADGNTVYVGVADEENHGEAGVYALDAGTGTVKWRFRTSTSIRHTVSVVDGRVHAATVDGTMFALDAGTGKRIWEYRLPNLKDTWMYASPVVQGGRVYGGVAPVFVALDAGTGEPVWQAEPLGADWVSCPASPVAGAGMIFVGFNWNIKGFFALDGETGAVRWNNTGRDYQAAHAAPSFADGMLYVAANGKVCALAADTGKEAWNVPVSGCGSTPVLADRTVLVGCADGKIIGLDRATGRQRWAYDKVRAGAFVFGPYQLEGASVIASPALSGQTAYWGTTDGRFLALDSETGAERWSVDLGAPITASAAVSGNTVLTATYDGTVYAFTAAR